MSRHTAHRLPWQDRWSEPTLDQLLKPLKAMHRRSIETLMDRLDALPGVTWSLRWYGVSWKWTIDYRFEHADADGQTSPTLCFVVPNQEQPLVCVPIEQDVVEQIPQRRLTRFARDGLKAAKCAITINWASWQPVSKADAEGLFDLIARRHKIVTSQQPTATAER